tara:strand:- start:488 stop:1708 length:1221 start_codon:yes stop_codon:yes gene_type:complete
MKKNFSYRLKNLGTETAFAVSTDAANFENEGSRVYPFHLGDINIPTPENIMDATLKALRDGKTGYNPSIGIEELRAVLCEKVGCERGVSFTPENVVVQPGGKPVISKFIQALMNPGDGVLYPNPGYPIYESQIEYFKGKALPYTFIHTDEGFVIDRQKFESLIDSNTKLLIYNNYQNPMGSESSLQEMEWIADLAIRHDLWVLSDEAYFNIQYSGTAKSIISLPNMQERTVILYTFSKTYAMTGWRLGAAIGPKSLMKIFSKLSVNDESCTNHFIQYGGVEAIKGSQEGVKIINNELKSRRDLLAEKLNSIEGVKLFLPNSTFYLFPDITDLYHKINARSYEDFRSKVLRATGVSFCTREHFGRPLPNESRKYIRFAYSGISLNEIDESMNLLKEFFSNSYETLSV